MWREKSPGLKILWLWTFGTAGVLVTNVMRTRMRDMEELINAQEQAPPPPDGGDVSTSTSTSTSAEES